MIESMVIGSKSLFHLLINRVYWDYNPLILTIDPDFRPGTSKCTMVCFFKTLPADGGRVPWFFWLNESRKLPDLGGPNVSRFPATGMSQDGSGWIVGDRINGLVGAYIYIYIYSI